MEKDFGDSHLDKYALIGIGKEGVSEGVYMRLAEYWHCVTWVLSLSKYHHLSIVVGWVKLSNNLWLIHPNLFRFSIGTSPAETGWTSRLAGEPVSLGFGQEWHLHLVQVCIQRLSWFILKLADCPALPCSADIYGISWGNEAPSNAKVWFIWSLPSPELTLHSLWPQRAWLAPRRNFEMFQPELSFWERENYIKINGQKD